MVNKDGIDRRVFGDLTITLRTAGGCTYTGPGSLALSDAWWESSGGEMLCPQLGDADPLERAFMEDEWVEVWTLGRLIGTARVDLPEPGRVKLRRFVPAEMR